MYYYVAPSELVPTPGLPGDSAWRPVGTLDEPASGWICMQPTGVGPEGALFLVSSLNPLTHARLVPFGASATEIVGDATKDALRAKLSYADPLRGTTVGEVIGQLLRQPPPNGWPALAPVRSGLHEVWLRREDGKSDRVWDDRPAKGSAIDSRVLLSADEVIHRADFSSGRRFRDSMYDWFGFVPFAGLVAYAAYWHPEWLPLLGALPFSDSFTNTDGTQIQVHNSGYVYAVNSYVKILSNQFGDTDAGGNYPVYWSGDAFNSDHKAQATVTTAGVAGNRVGLCTRASSTGNVSYFYFGSSSSNDAYMRRSSTANNNIVIQDSINGPYSVSDVLLMQANGSSQSMQRNGTHQGSSPWTDTNLTGGAPGPTAWGNGASNLIDDLILSNLATPSLLVRRDPMAHMLVR